MSAADSESGPSSVRERMELLHAWLARRLSTDALEWLDEQIWLIGVSNRSLQLGIALTIAPRKLGDAPLTPSAQELVAAQNARDGLTPFHWTIDEVGRMLLVLASWKGSDAAFAGGVDKAFASASETEQAALLRGFALFPSAPMLLTLAVAAAQCPTKAVFEAIAHNNPYPREQFSEAQWNQMVVNALRIESRLAPIQMLDDRRNHHLARMLIDHAYERKAAGFDVPNELWRCVGPYAGDEEIALLENLLLYGCEREAAAAALALSECNSPAARAALSTRPRLQAAVNARTLTWSAF